MSKQINILISTILAGASFTALTSDSRAAVYFPDSGVWLQPRIFLNNSAVQDYSALEPGNTYSFRTQLNEKDGVDSPVRLYGEVTGPQNFSNDWGIIIVPAGGTSTRSWSQLITTPGQYKLDFTISGREGLPDATISRNFTVIPEPNNFSLFLLGTSLISLRRVK